MATPKLLGIDLSIPTYAWSAGANASYPISNLKNGYPDSVSKSNATTDGQQFTIDFGSAVACNMIVLEGFNGATQDADGVAMSLQADDNSGFSSPETIIGSGAWDLIEDTIAQAQSFASKTYRYWRIVFTKGSALTTKPEIGNIFLGTSLDFEDPAEETQVMNMPSHETVSVMTALDGRRRTARTSGGRLNWRMRFALQSDAFATLWYNFLLTVGNSFSPFYLIDFNGAVWCVRLKNGYNPATKQRYNQNDVEEFELETILANY